MTARKKEPVTGYGNLQRLTLSINRQIRQFEKLQKSDPGETDVFAKLHDLTRAAALVQAELRKTSDDAEKAFAKLSLERRVELVLGLIEKFPPDYRRAIGVRISELGDALQ